MCTCVCSCLSGSGPSIARPTFPKVRSIVRVASTPCGPSSGDQVVPPTTNKRATTKAKPMLSEFAKEMETRFGKSNDKGPHKYKHTHKITNVYIQVCTYVSSPINTHTHMHTYTFINVQKVYFGFFSGLNLPSCPCLFYSPLRLPRARLPAPHSSPHPRPARLSPTPLRAPTAAQTILSSAGHGACEGEQGEEGKLERAVL